MEYLIKVYFHVSFYTNNSERRKRVSSVLAKHTRLLEILELPQLVETCVRNGHYEEALELRQFSAKVSHDKNIYVMS